MDFTPRGSRPVGQEPQPQNNQPVSHAAPQPARTSKPVRDGRDWSRLMTFLMLLATAAVAVGVISLLIFGTPSQQVSQGNYVNTERYQAVFLNGGQVYFGKIVKFNDDVVALKDIFYLRVNQQVQPGQTDQNAANNISLAKLGSELHGPEDLMFINRREVQFWENLKDEGQVVQAIKKYQADPEAANQQQAPAAAENTNNTSNTNETTNDTNTNNTNTNTNNTTNRR